MRQPTDLTLVYAWHSQAMGHVVVYQGKNIAPIAIGDEPQAGWFKTQLVRKGPWVPACIWLDQPTDPRTGELIDPEEYRCEVDGVPQDVDRYWLFLCKQPITESEFQYLTALRRWQRANAPEEFDAAWKPVDHLSSPILD